MRAVILAGGKGTRLAPYTTVFPKPLMPVAEHPILELVLRRLKKHGITRVTLAVGYLAELIQTFFQDGSALGMEIDYSREEAPLGTAGPLALLDGLDETFLLMNGDLLTTLDFGKLLAHHRAKKAQATIAVSQREVRIDYGVIEIDGGGTVTGYREKPSLSYDISMGINLFEPSVLSHVPRGEPTDVPDVIRRILASGGTVAAYRSKDYWLDIGRHDDYSRAMEEFESVKAEFL